jgi:glycerol-3-phosphate acyltransferase PlsX
MGGDDAPRAIVAGAVLAVRSGLDVILVGNEAVLRPLIPRALKIPVVHAPQVIAMGEPATAARRKPDSSMRRALDLVHAGDAVAAFSCGNSGAWLVNAVMVLQVFDGIERPAIATVLPRFDGGRFVMLDAGANVDCRPGQLVGFALLGAAYAQMLGVERPTIGLLSNGEEPSKGNMLVRSTLPLLQELDLDVVGNVEPPAALRGACDVLVCDGFVGNAVLKSLEGAVELVAELLADEIRRRPSARMGTRLMGRAFRGFRERLGWDVSGSAVLLGTRGAVIVGHGGATADDVASGIALADSVARGGLVEHVRARVES